MANTSSAKKRVRQNIKRRSHNQPIKSSIRTYEKKIRKFISSSELNKAKEIFPTFSSILDRAAKKNLIHKNRANKKKSHFSILLNQKSQAQTQGD